MLFKRPTSSVEHGKVVSESQSLKKLLIIILRLRPSEHQTYTLHQQRLQSQIQETIPEWRDKFLSYKQLKKRLKLIAAPDCFTEAAFDASSSPSRGDGGVGIFCSSNCCFSRRCC
jgi:hypothetical protein